MPHYLFEYNVDGTISRILRDGQPIEQGVRLEQMYSVVTTYFTIASQNLHQMQQNNTDATRRYFGLQSFVMSLTGMEAFTNTYFHLRAQELENNEMLDRIAQTHGSLSRKIADLLEMTPDPPLRDQDMLINRIWQFSQMRNEIVHPRWQPSQLTLGGPVPIIIQGLVENRQALFEDITLCREAHLWCLLLIARIAEARGHADVSGFMFYWTANYQLTLPTLLSELGLPPDS